MDTSHPQTASSTDAAGAHACLNPAATRHARPAWRVWRDGVDTHMVLAFGCLCAIPLLILFLPGATVHLQAAWAVLVGWRLAGTDNPGLRWAPAVGMALGVVWTLWHLFVAEGPVPHAPNPHMDFSWTLDQDLNTILFTGGMLAFVLATIGLAVGSALTGIGRLALRALRGRAA